MCILFELIIYKLLYSGSRCPLTDDSIHDVVFVIDASISSRFIKKLIANITIGFINNSPNSAVGVILFATSAYIKFDLQANTNPRTLLSAINELYYRKRSWETNTDKALALLLETARNGTLRLRNDSRKVAIIITDDGSDDKSATSSVAATLHASNIFDVYAIGVDDDEADLTELETIASSPEFIFIARAYDGDGLAELRDKYLLRLINPECDSKCLMTA